MNKSSSEIKIAIDSIKAPIAIISKIIPTSKSPSDRCSRLNHKTTNGNIITIPITNKINNFFGIDK